MELRQLALRILHGQSLAEKLAPPEQPLTDDVPGAELRIAAPTRPARLQIVPGARAKVPALEGMADPTQRVRIIHGSANHELQAIEGFAWALLAFPAADRRFRRGLVRLLADEQRHCGLYINRMRELGVDFGDFAVSGYIWGKLTGAADPLHFVCTMCLTFETANLDHAADYARLARRYGDDATAAVFERVGAEEIPHVRFGWHWLERLKPAGVSPWQAYRASLTYPVRPALGRGRTFNAAARRAAGLTEDVIEALGSADEN